MCRFGNEKEEFMMIAGRRVQDTLRLLQDRQAKQVAESMKALRDAPELVKLRSKIDKIALALNEANEVYAEKTGSVYMKAGKNNSYVDYTNYRGETFTSAESKLREKAKAMVSSFNDEAKEQELKVFWKELETRVCLTQKIKLDLIAELAKVEEFLLTLDIA